MPSVKKTRRNARKKCIPYARGFRLPTAKSSQDAIGMPVGKELKHLKVLDGFFGNIPKPTSVDDWLAQYNDKGQTFKRFCEQNPWLSSRKVKNIKHTFFPKGKNIVEKYPDGKIYIVLLGRFDQQQINVDALQEYARLFFHVPVILSHSVDLEQIHDQVSWVDVTKDEQRKRHHRLRTRYNADTKRIQISVDSLLQRLQASIPDDALCMIGLTMYDMYADNTDLFVAGMAAGQRRVAVFSLYRYDPNIVNFSPELWYDYDVDISDKTKSKEDQNRLLLLRSCRLLVHEIGHLFGIGHCIYFACCMNGSGHLEEDFRQPMFLCPVDLHKLETLCGFDVLDRYQKLLHFFTKHKMEEEIDWLSKRIDFIESDMSS